MAIEKTDEWATAFLAAAGDGEIARARDFHTRIKEVESTDIAIAQIVEMRRGSTESLGKTILLGVLGFSTGILLQTYFPMRITGRIGAVPTILGTLLSGYSMGLLKDDYETRAMWAVTGLGVGLGGACVTFPIKHSTGQGFTISGNGNGNSNGG